MTIWKNRWHIETYRNKKKETCKKKKNLCRYSVNKLALFNEPKIAIFAIWQKYEGCEIQRGARESEVYWQAYKPGKEKKINIEDR
jgi:hypothetical protein